MQLVAWSMNCGFLQRQPLSVAEQPKVDLGEVTQGRAQAAGGKARQDRQARRNERGGKDALGKLACLALR